MTFIASMTHRVALFAVACLLAGLGGVVGSIVGHATGSVGLMVGGVVGGLLGAVASAFIARGRGWIRAPRVGLTAIGACVGFLAAALIATHTLSSALGPVLSTLLVGLGAVLGAGRHHDRA